MQGEAAGCARHFRPLDQLFRSERLRMVLEVFLVMLHPLLMVFHALFVMLHRRFMMLDRGFVVLYRSFSMHCTPIRMMRGDPIGMIGAPPSTIMPFVAIIPVAVPTPVGMSLDPFGMVRVDPVGIVYPPPFGVAPHMVLIVGAPQRALTRNTRMLLQP